METARDETRDAAAAFSAALTLRAWWMHARHANGPARAAAVEAMLGPRRRGLAHEVLQAWAMASPAPLRAVRATNWRSTRLQTTGW